jgi:hypothetical protein
MQDKPVSPRQLCGARTRAKGDFRYREADTIKQRYRRLPAGAEEAHDLNRLLFKVLAALSSD